MDRRQIKTKKAIYESLNRLLLRKPYSQITIQNIIDEADVGRSTFYTHFETKDALLQDMCSDFFSHVMGEPKEKEATHDFTNSPADLENMVTHILYHLRDSSSSIGGLLKGDTSAYFYTHLKETFSKWCLGNIHFSSRIPKELSISLISGELVSLCHWWINSSFLEEPETAASYFLYSATELF